ncbi:kinase-like protein [Ustulina deusta]|nr:kinase-like protein [Ustulina deusta]
MPLNRLARYIPFSRLAHRTGIRMVSTIVGESGCVYVQGEVLQRHREDYNFSIFKAKSKNKLFVVKRVLRPFYNLFLRFNNLDFLALQLHKILRHVAEAIEELYSKNWIYIDIKPDNILLNWTCDNEGNETVTDVALGDFDIACKLEDGQLLQTRYAIGNAMWRSPEGQTGTGVTKASDIFLFGLVVSNENWRCALKAALRVAEQVVNDDPGLRFTEWGAEFGPVAQNMISGMTNLDPTARTTINQVLSY